MVHPFRGGGVHPSFRFQPRCHGYLDWNPPGAQPAFLVLVTPPANRCDKSNGLMVDSWMRDCWRSRRDHAVVIGSPQLVQYFWSPAFSLPHFAHFNAVTDCAACAPVSAEGVGVGFVSGASPLPRLDFQNSNPPTTAAATTTIPISGR